MKLMEKLKAMTEKKKIKIIKLAIGIETTREKTQDHEESILDPQIGLKALELEQRNKIVSQKDVNTLAIFIGLWIQDNEVVLKQ